MNTYIKELIESFFNKNINLSGFVKLYNRIQDDINDWGSSGFSIVFNKTNINVWDDNGNYFDTIPLADTPLYDNFIDVLKSKYKLELIDTNRLGQPKAYKYEIYKKGINESFFDELEDDLDVSDDVYNTVSGIATLTYINDNCKTIYTNLTKYPYKIDGEMTEKYIRYNKLANFILDGNPYKDKKHPELCEYNIELYNNADDIITIDTSKLNSYGNGRFILYINGNDITYAILPNCFLFNRSLGKTINIDSIIQVYVNTGFVIKSLCTNDVDIKYKDIWIDLNKISSFDDYIKYLSENKLPTIVNKNDEICKFTQGCEIQNFRYNNDVKNIITLLADNIKNTYKFKSIQYTFTDKDIFPIFLKWSIEHNNVLFSIGSKTKKEELKDYIIHNIKQYLIENNMRYGSMGYTIDFYDTYNDKKYGKYVETTANISFFDDISKKYLYIDFKLNVYMSGKIDIINVKKS